MKFLLFCLGLALLSGCGAGDERQTGRRVIYPALNESPPPPMRADPRFPELPVEKTASQATDIGAVEDSFMQRQVQKEELLKSMRNYAAKAAPGDPFALTKEEIDKLSKVDGLLVY